MYATALVLIARNEQRCLARCLDSVRPWVDELIVLDTGSTDATVDIARQAGARVHHFRWVDDFSAARNAALSHTDADWRIVLDADEWLEEGGAVLAALRDTPPAFVGAIEVRSRFEAGTEGAATDEAVASSWISRVLPRGVRYEGLVHEQPAHALPVQRLPVRAGHDGYLPEQMHLKGDRNQTLLQAALAARPDDAYLLYQLGKDHEIHDRFEPAHQAYAPAFRRAPPNAPWRHDLVLRHLYTLKATGRLPEAVQTAEQELPHWPHSADFYFVMGDLLLDFAMAHPDQAADVLPMIEASWQQCLALGDTLYLEGAVEGRGSHLAAHNLAAFHESLGQVRQAEHYRELSRQLRQSR